MGSLFGWANKRRLVILSIINYSTLIFFNVVFGRWIETILVMIGMWIIRRNPNEAHLSPLWKCFVVSCSSIILMSLLPWWLCIQMGILFALVIQSPQGLRVVNFINRL